VGPDYAPPPDQAPAAWHAELAGGENAAALDPHILERWWDTLNDGLLSDLEQQAVRSNLDLKQALSRVREARARRGISGAALFPTLDLSAAATRSRSSESSGSGDTREAFNAGFDAGWELDLFGGVRRSREAAEADLQAGMAGLYDVLVSLTAEVGLNYVETRTYQTRLTVARDNLSAQEETFNLIRDRYSVGLSNELELQQARYNLESTRSRIPDLRTGLEAALNRLAVLTAQHPGRLHEILSPPGPIPVIPATIAVGIPAETLRQRPDIRQAERELAAQTARIGVATADLYPKLRLSGSIGLDSTEAGELLKWSSRSWSYGPGISWNIFDAGALRNTIRVQEALQEQTLLAYETTVLSALEEVENALVAYAQEQVRRNHLLEAADAARMAERLSRDQYTAGLIDFSNVLEAQRALLSYQDQLAQSDGTLASDLIRLYKALGGGWVELQ
jgi:NodT family efflux transporter outer membrane factor (OMF) lipoprotein